MPNSYGQFVPDPLSPSGYRWKRHDEPEPTGMLPVVSPHPRAGGTVRDDEYEDHLLSGPDHPGGDWANPEAYLSYDDVDSRSVIDTGAPE